MLYQTLGLPSHTNVCGGGSTAGNIDRLWDTDGCATHVDMWSSMSRAHWSGSAVALLPLYMYMALHAVPSPKIRVRCQDCMKDWHYACLRKQETRSSWPQLPWHPVMGRVCISWSRISCTCCFAYASHGGVSARPPVTSSPNNAHCRGAGKALMKPAAQHNTVKRSVSPGPAGGGRGQSHLPKKSQNNSLLKQRVSGQWLLGERSTF